MATSVSRIGNHLHSIHKTSKLEKEHGAVEKRDIIKTIIQTLY
jgi:hypothetical protein